jgi:hypothetical protein
MLDLETGELTKAVGPQAITAGFITPFPSLGTAFACYETIPLMCNL